MWFRSSFAQAGLFREWSVWRQSVKCQAFAAVMHGRASARASRDWGWAREDLTGLLATVPVDRSGTC